MQEFEASIVFIRINNKLIVHRDHPGRTILAGATEVNLDATEVEVKHWRYALDPLDHASGNGRKKQLGRIEGVRPAIDIRIKSYLCVFCRGDAAVAIDSTGADAIF